MATTGDQLLAPESGWTRFDDANEYLLYTGTWNAINNDNYYNKTAHYTTTINSSVSFIFNGNKLRVLGYRLPTGAIFTVTIDGVEYTATSNGISQFQTILYENISLSNGVHTVKITKSGETNTLWFDAIDIEGQLLNNEKKAIVKNPVTNQYYSLAEKTLIPLPSSSDKNMILWGIEQGKEIQLDVPFNKIITVTENGDDAQTVVEEDVEPFSVYDYISETPEVIVYTESTDDITVSTTTEPYDLYDEFGNELEVLYYTDDETVTEADLILEANWSPIDELKGDFEVVTWTDEPQESAQRVLEMTAIPKPQFVKMVQANSLINKIKEMDVIDRSYGYKNNTRFLLTDTYGINWYVWNKNVNNFTTINTTNDSLLDVGMTAEEINNITTDQWSLWNKDTVNVGIYMYNSPRDNIISEVENISLQEDINKYTPELSNLLFYILNTTAKINVQLDGNVLKGEVSDDDLTRVQYRVLLNGHPYFPENGEFTPLGAPPVNIDLVISGKDVKIDEDNVLKVEFKDYFGTVDYWQTSFTGMYAGLIFKDIYGNYYSTEVGEVLRYLDFGDIIAGQTTVEHEVLLKNQYGFDVSNLVLKADSSEFPNGMEAQFSKTQSPFISEPELNFTNLTNNTEIPFFVRLKTQLGVTPVANGDFAITVNADKT